MSDIILGVSGGIAAYKACELVRRLVGEGHDVTVVPTDAALEFVGVSTWAALSGKPVHTQVWDDVHLVPHVKLGQDTDLVYVVPATADLLARAASGRADDLLTNVLLTARSPVVFAPRCTPRWLHPATQTNVATLRARGSVVVEPDSGRLAGPDSGPGRLPDPVELFAVAAAVLADPGVADRAASQDLAGLTVAVSAGGTREHLDPCTVPGQLLVGADGLGPGAGCWATWRIVRLVAANVTAPPPPNIGVHHVTSTADLAEAMTVAAKDADLVVMAAAPADFAPAGASETKIKKSGSAGLQIDLVQTPDVLAGLAAGAPIRGRC